MTYVTPQTAAALKAAGFPQPAPKKGQKWESQNGLSFVLTGESDALYTASNPCLFLPAADDILRAMPGISVRYDAVKKAFVCGIAGVWGEWGKSHSETLPEALALAYLNAQNPK